jgi:hypothetical protein
VIVVADASPLQYLVLIEHVDVAQPPVPDLEFAADVRAAVSAHDTPLEPTAWD